MIPRREIKLRHRFRVKGGSTLPLVETTRKRAPWQRGAQPAFDAAREPCLATEARGTAGRVAQGRARAATLALLPGSGPPAPRADAARAAAVAAVAS